MKGLHPDQAMHPHNRLSKEGSLLLFVCFPRCTGSHVEQCLCLAGRSNCKPPAVSSKRPKGPFGIQSSPDEIGKIIGKHASFCPTCDSFVSCFIVLFPFRWCLYLHTPSNIPIYPNPASLSVRAHLSRLYYLLSPSKSSINYRSEGALL